MFAVYLGLTIFAWEVMVIALWKGWPGWLFQFIRLIALALAISIPTDSVGAGVIASFLFLCPLLPA